MRTPRSRNVRTFCLVAGWLHIPVFIAGARMMGRIVASRLDVRRLSAMPFAILARVVAVAGATRIRSAQFAMAR